MSSRSSRSISSPARRRAAAPSPARRPTSSRFSRPVRNSSRPAYWPVTPMRRRTWSASATTSNPSTSTGRRSGRIERGEHPDQGGLAGAVVAEHAERRARVARRGRSPSRACTSRRRRRARPRRRTAARAHRRALRAVPAQHGAAVASTSSCSTRCRCVAGVLVGVVGEDGVELPAAEGHVGGVDPHLVLHGVAAAVGLGHAVARGRRRRTARRRRRRRPVERTSTPRWLSGDVGVRVLEQHQLERRVGDLEVGVARRAAWPARRRTGRCRSGSRRRCR